MAYSNHGLSNISCRWFACRDICFCSSVGFFRAYVVRFVLQAARCPVQRDEGRSPLHDGGDALIPETQSRVIGYVERFLVTSCIALGLAVFLIPVFAMKLMLRQNAANVTPSYGSYVYLGSLVSASFAVFLGIMAAAFLSILNIPLNLGVYVPLAPISSWM